MLNEALRYVEQNRERFLEEYKEFLRIPSVSTDEAHRPDIQRAAAWVADQLRQIGMERVEIYPTPRHPIVYGEWLKAGSARPTVLIYGHYDVQPADPLEEWQSPPFEPTIRGENLYARGASDMKGQVMLTLKALEALAQTGGLPIHVKVLIEGEEEIGSPSLEAFLRSHQEMLRCDFSLNPDAGMLGADLPTITYGLRGLAYFELRVYGPAQDLHSGVYGGAVHNPAQALVELLAGMHDAEGRVTLPGFYDAVRPLSAEERAELARLPLDEAFFLQQTGAPALYGEAGYTVVERVGARPTLDINGLKAGFINSGAKTVLPAMALAKISMRLVPDQDPQEVHQQLRRYLEERAPATIRWELLAMHGSRPTISRRDTPWVRALSQAMEAVYGCKPYFRREGGSIPVVAQLQDILGVESVITGFGLPDDNLHAPNEKQNLPNWYRGIETILRFLTVLGEANV
jgi:acetylornithine deacetylase/succinyl-diaminopimelate desuccinylase-like protein